MPARGPGGGADAPRPGGLRRRVSSIRARSTLAAVVVVAVALTVGALALVALLRSSLEEGVESSGQNQAANIVSLLRLGPLPTQLPTGRGDLFTQVVAGGRVLASSPTLTPTVPISDARPGEEGVVIHDVPVVGGVGDGDGGDNDGPYLLVSRSVVARTSTGAPVEATVYVAGSLRTVEAATRTVGLALVVGLPVVAVLVGLLVWYLTGRALRPVEEIRGEVSDITLHDLHRRVPAPATYDEVARLASTMNEMLDRLEASAQTQRRFVSDASHELRSPLAALTATLEVAVAHPADGSLELAATDALVEARRLARLVDDLLVLARADERVGEARRHQIVDLDELVFAELGRRPPGERVAIDVHGVSGGRVEGDADELSRVLHNLVDNAVRHAATTVRVSVTAGEDEVRLVVADDGTGVAAGDRRRILERFTRLDEGRSRDQGGSGLGLAIVAELVAAHGGRLEVGDAHPGARFEISLPTPAPWR